MCAEISLAHDATYAAVGHTGAPGEGGSRVANRSLLTVLFTDRHEVLACPDEVAR